MDNGAFILNININNLHRDPKLDHQNIHVVKERTGFL